MSFTQDTVYQQIQHTTGLGPSGFNAGAYGNAGLSSSQLQPSQMFSMTQPQQQGAGLPGWASELIKDVKHIKLSMTKFEQIEKTVNMIKVIEKQ